MERGQRFDRPAKRFYLLTCALKKQATGDIGSRKEGPTRQICSSNPMNRCGQKQEKKLKIRKRKTYAASSDLKCSGGTGDFHPHATPPPLRASRYSPLRFSCFCRISLTVPRMGGYADLRLRCDPTPTYCLRSLKRLDGYSQGPLRISSPSILRARFVIPSRAHRSS